MQVKHIFILLLVIICFFLAYGEIDAVNWYEVLIEMIFYSPFPIILFFLSKSTKAKDMGWLKKLDYVGIYVSVATIVILLFVFVRELIRYYF